MDIILGLRVIACAFRVTGFIWASFGRALEIYRLRMLSLYIGNATVVAYVPVVAHALRAWWIADMTMRTLRCCNVR